MCVGSGVGLSVPYLVVGLVACAVLILVVLFLAKSAPTAIFRVSVLLL